MIQDHNGDGIKTRCGCVLGTARPPDRDLYNAVLQHYIIVITLRAKLSGAVYCNRSCLWVGLWLYFCGCICYHDNSKLRASILIKLGL